MDSLRLRVLNDIDQGRVSLTADRRVDTSALRLDPDAKAVYDREVLVVMDAALAMEVKPGGVGSGRLRLTTMGTIRLARRSEAVV